MPSSRAYCTQPLSLAPMIDKSDRDWRWVMRRITRKTLMYSEMIAAPAILHGKRDRLLEFDPSEKPLVLQLGWDEEEPLAEACRIAADYGYDEINLNCGCPSDKVQRHDFGACLMARPSHVARLVEAMASATDLPVSVKHRIGIRSRKTGLSLETYENLKDFVSTVAGAGCGKFTVHSRIAILEGLSPRENRDIPPLRPEEVYRLKADFPGLFIEINGGIRSVEQIQAALGHVDAVMLGRIALDNPWMLADADRLWFAEPDRCATDDRPGRHGPQNASGTAAGIGACPAGAESTTHPPADEAAPEAAALHPAISRRSVLEDVVPYLASRAQEGASLGALIQPIMNLFAGRRGARLWKRTLSALPAAGRSRFGRGLEDAVALMDPELLDERAGLLPPEAAGAQAFVEV